LEKISGLLFLAHLVCRARAHRAVNFAIAQLSYIVRAISFHDFQPDDMTALCIIVHRAVKIVWGQFLVTCLWIMHVSMAKVNKVELVLF